VDRCVFCMIVRREMPARVVFEDDGFIAFDDITPQAPVHTLIVPKQHFASMSDDIPAEVLGGLLATVAKVAELKGVTESGYRVIVNNGSDACQSVPHLHVHILGGDRMSHGMVRFGDCSAE
jgi:histidine triad (HIT) family protein